MGRAALPNKKMCMVIGHLGLRRAHALQADVCTLGPRWLVLGPGIDHRHIRR